MAGKKSTIRGSMVDEILRRVNKSNKREEEQRKSDVRNGYIYKRMLSTIDDRVKKSERIGKTLATTNKNDRATELLGGAAGKTAGDNPRTTVEIPGVTTKSTAVGTPYSNPFLDMQQQKDRLSAPAGQPFRTNVPQVTVPTVGGMKAPQTTEKKDTSAEAMEQIMAGIRQRTGIQAEGKTGAMDTVRQTGPARGTNRLGNLTEGLIKTGSDRTGMEPAGNTPAGVAMPAVSGKTAAAGGLAAPQIRQQPRPEQLPAPAAGRNYGDMLRAAGNQFVPKAVGINQEVQKKLAEENTQMPTYGDMLKWAGDQKLNQMVGIIRENKNSPEYRKEMRQQQLEQQKEINEYNKQIDSADARAEDFDTMAVRQYAKNHWQEEIDKWNKIRERYASGEGMTQNRITGYQEYQMTPQGRVRWILDEGWKHDSPGDEKYLPELRDIVESNPDLFPDAPYIGSWTSLNMDRDVRKYFDKYAPRIGTTSGSEVISQIDGIISQYQQKIDSMNEVWGEADKKINEMLATGDPNYYGVKKNVIDEWSAKFGASWTGQMEGRNADEVYYMANEGTTYQMPGGVSTWLRGKNPLQVIKANPAYMTDVEKDTFNKLYNLQLYDEAYAFYQGLSRQINRRVSTEQENINRGLAKLPVIGVFKGLQTVPSSVFNLPERLYAAGAATFGDKNMQDPNNYIWRQSTIDTAVREERGNKVDQYAQEIGLPAGTGKILTETAYSVMDNLFAMALSGGLAGGAKNVSETMLLTIMSSQAGVGKFKEALDNDMDPKEAMFLSVASAIIEWQTEQHLSLEAFLKPDIKEMLGNRMQVMKYLAKNIGAEASEEAIGTVLERFVQSMSSSITGSKTDIQRMAEQYAAEIKAKDSTISDDDAYWQGMRKAEEQWLLDLAKSAGEGGLSALWMSGARVAANKISNISLGGAIRDNNVKGNTNLRENKAYIKYMTDIGMSMDENSNSYQLAKAMQNRLNNNKRISRSSLGRLYTAISFESSENVRNETTKAIVSTIKGDLTGMGMQHQEAELKAELIAKAVSQGIGALNKQEQRALASDERAYQIYTAMVEPDTKENSWQLSDAAKETAKAAKEAAAEASAEGKVNLGLAQTIAAGKLQPARPIAVGKDSLKAARSAVAMAGDADLEQLKGAAKSTVIAYTKTDDGTGLKTDAVTGQVIGFDNGKVKVQLADGTEKLLKAGEIEVTDGNAQGIIGYMTDNAGMMSDKVAGKAMAALDAAGDKASANFAQDVVNINFAARTGQAMPANSLDSETASELFKTAQEDAAEAEKNRLKGTGMNVKPGQGKATYEGAVYGTKEWTEKTKGMDDAQKRTLKYAGQFAKTFGFQVNFINDTSEAGKAMNGHHVNGVLTINLAVTNADETAHNPLASIGHEMTHWLQENSPEMYKKLYSFVVNDLQRNGVDLQERVAGNISLYNAYYKKIEAKDANKNPRVQTIDDAMYEIVCESCDQLLTSEEFANRLKEADPETHGKIRQFIETWIGKLRQALRGSASYEARHISDIDEMARIWLGGYDEVIHGIATGKPNAEVTTIAKEQAAAVLNDALKEKPQGSFSLAAPVEVREDGLVAMHNISAQNLMKVLQQGGIASPSTAVVPITAEWKNFGDISIYFNRGVAERAVKAGRAYAGDAFTPVLRSDISSTQEAMDFLRTQPERRIHPQDLTDAFRNYKKMTNVEDMRKKAYRNQNRTESDVRTNEKVLQDQQNKVNSVMMDAVFDGLHNQGKTEAEIGKILENNYWNIERATARGALMAAEEIERQQASGKYNWEIDTEGIIGEAITKELSEFFDTKGFDLENNDDLDEAVMSFIAMADNLLGSQMQEVKPDEIVGFGDIAAVEVPANTSEELIRQLVEAGIPEERIYRYETGNDADRANVANSIKGIEGISFSVKDTTVTDPAELAKALESEPETAYDPKSHDIRYKLADPKTRNVLSMFARWQVAQNEQQKESILRKAGLSNAEIKTIISGGVLREGGYEQYGLTKNQIKTLEMLDRDTAKWENAEMDSLTMDEDDLEAQYIKAWHNNDTETMERLLMEKYAGEDGVIPYKAPHWYDSQQHRWIANAIKEKNPEALAIAAWEMSRLVPKNAVLVPMPPHTGVVTEDTDTMALAKKIGELTGRPVINALEGIAREKRYDSKLNNSVKNQITAEGLGFRQVADIPEGTIPYYIDNVIASGTTAKAAHDALGMGLTLAYAKSTRSAIPELKNAAATFIDPKTQMYLIPLSARGDMEKTGVSGLSYSLKQRDADYQAAVDSGDMETAQRMVDEKLEEQGYRIRGDHGTVSKYFTVFDREKGNAEGDWGKGFYFTNNPDDVRTNYASEEGPDLVSKIEQLADQMEWMDEYADKDFDERYKAAKEMLAGGEPRIIHGALRMDNPVTLGGENETIFDYNEEYDEENDEYGEPEGKLVEFIDALKDVLSEYPYARVDVDELYSEGMDYGGLKASDLEKLAKELVMDVQDDDGKLAGNEIVREAFERMGFDGIVDNTVAWKFGSKTGRGSGMVGVNENTTHYIVFQPNQIKQSDPVTYDDNGNVIPLSERGNTESNDIRYSIKQLNDGTKYVEIDTDQDQFKGKKSKEMLIMASKIIKKMFVSGDRSKNLYEFSDKEKAYIDSRTADEYAHPTKGKMKEAIKRAKGKASTELDNLMKIATEIKPGDKDYPNASNHQFKGDTIGFKYYRTLFEVNGRFFTGVINVEQKGTHDRIKDVTQIKIDESRSWPNNNSSRQANANALVGAANAQNNIPQNGANSNKKSFSLKNPNPNMDVQVWMESVPESSLATEAERSLLRSYKDLRMAIDVARDKQRNYKRRIEELKAKGDSITPQEKRLMEGLKIRVQNAEAAQAAHEAKLEKITSSEGYAGMMHQQQQLMDDYVQGKTQDEVIEAVAGMEKTAERLGRDIEKAAADLKAMADSEGVRRIRARIGGKSVDNIASQIRKDYNSTINKQELMNDLARIRLEIENGNDPTEAIEELAGKILDKRKASERNASLEHLRGVTIRLGEKALQEIYGSNSNIKEIRRMLAGSGVRIAKAAEGRGSLDANWEELVSFVPTLDHYNGYDTDNALDQAKAVAEFVQNAMEEQQKAGRNELAGMMDDVFLDISGKLSLIDLDLPSDPKARKAVQSLSNYVVELAKEANKSAKTIENLQKQIAEMAAGGRKAANWSKAMKADVALTIDYFNKTAKMAVDEAKRQKQSEIIQQLKDKHVQEMLKKNDEWRALIQRDADARKQADKNVLQRRKISTVMNRINKLLASETDVQNIPENYKGLARELLRMFADNDLGEGGRKVTSANRKTLARAKELLNIWEKQDGPFNPADLTSESGQDPEGIIIRVMDDFRTIEEALKEWNGRYNGKNKLDTLQQMGSTLERMQEAVSEIYSIIQAGRTMDINGRKYQVEEMGLRFLDGTKNSRFKGEATKAAGKAIDRIRKIAISGNTTPEYFFRQLKNAGLDEIWNEFKRGENRNGLEIAKAKNKLGEIAAKHGYKNWDLKKQITVKTLNGDVKMTLEQVMALWATWKREQNMGPEQSQHLTKGGFYVAEEGKGKGLTGRQKTNATPHIMDEQTMAAVGEQLTDEQKAYVDEMVRYMSSDLSELGNEASMRMYGIKKYKESYYYPFKRWMGVGNFSSDRGSQATDDNRAAHKGWTKRRQNMASNALEIGDFTKTVVNHAVEMINYNTMAPAIEAMNKMLNWQNTEYQENGTTVKRNMRAVFEQQYGKDAREYLETLLKDLNGGVSQDPRGSTLDKLLSVFKKGAVAGSLSVAAQQPLSYIRAAMEINPKYLARALSPDTWKGSYKEMMAHSGVAVIKEMGRFDMGYGASAKEYITPEAMQTRRQKIGNFLNEKSTMLPEMMDRMTWTRMWSAVKAEQKALHPDMDVRSDEFLDMVGERFNEVMRLTQVYDSSLVKSSNMRSKNFALKSFTSFMAEPTLSLNVLRDAALNVKGKGGIRKAAMACATFMLSAIAQAAAKGVFGAGRNPDEQKTKEENFEYRMLYNLINELNPMSLIPGYSDLVEALTEGEMSDNVMTPVGKMLEIIQTIQKANDKTNPYRFIEDTAGQIAQLFTGVPMKNIMRDTRAMFNWFMPDSTITAALGGKAYANRPDSNAVRKYQAIDTVMKQDLVGMVNKWLGDAGYQTTNTAYYKRIYEAEKAGDENAVNEMTEYLLNGKGANEKTLNSNVAAMARKDESLTSMEKAEIVGAYGGKTTELIKEAAENGEISLEEAVQELGNEVKDPGKYVKDQLKEGKISKEEATEQLKKLDPDLDDNSVYWTVDRIEYQKETGAEKVSGTYYRLWDAMDANKAEEIGTAVDAMLKHGVKKESIKSQITSQYKKAYIEADNNGKRKIRDAVQKAYRKLGFTAEDADKIIKKWK